MLLRGPHEVRDPAGLLLILDVPLQVLLCTFIFTHDGNCGSGYHQLLLLLQEKRHQGENR